MTKQPKAKTRPHPTIKGAIQVRYEHSFPAQMRSGRPKYFWRTARHVQTRLLKRRG